MTQNLGELFQSAFLSGNFWMAGLLAVGAGLLTSLGPCVYPVIPITLSVLGARRYDSFLHGFFVSFVYVLGMVLLFVFLGIAFSAFGMVAGAALQNVWVLLAVALLFFALAMSMFGAFDLALPHRLMVMLSSVGRDGLKGVFLMGLVAGVVAVPCTGPVLAFILTLIAADHDFARGAALMVLFGAGMGLPFLVLGTFSSMISRIPKSGAWMNVFKNLLGLGMLAGAVYYLQLAVPFFAKMFSKMASTSLGWALGFLFLGIVLGALHLSLRSPSLSQRVSKLLSVFCCAIGFGVLTAWSTLSISSSSSHAEMPTWHEINENTPDAGRDLDRLLSKAVSETRPVLIDWYARWCLACKELDLYTYTDQNVIKELQRFVSIKIDVTKDTQALRLLQERFKIVGLPTVLMMNSAGLDQSRLFGFVPADRFIVALKAVR